jgi:hypothetical protein
VYYSCGKQRGEIQVKIPQDLKDFLLPKREKIQWTWQRVFLLAIAILVFVDSLIVPYSPGLDPGRSGAGLLFLILAFRAESRSKLPTAVVVMGTLLAALISCMNHGLVRSPSLVWTPLGILLLLLVVFWGRGKREPAKSGG